MDVQWFAEAPRSNMSRKDKSSRFKGLNGFSENVLDILSRMDFQAQGRKIDEGGGVPCYH